jgi:hypothetical protein
MKRTKRPSESLVNVSDDGTKLRCVESGQLLQSYAKLPLATDAGYARGYTCNACHKTFTKAPLFHSPVSGTDCCSKCGNAMLRAAAAASNAVATTAPPKRVAPAQRTPYFGWRTFTDVDVSLDIGAVLLYAIGAGDVTAGVVFDDDTTVTFAFDETPVDPQPSSDLVGELQAVRVAFVRSWTAAHPSAVADLCDVVKRAFSSDRRTLRAARPEDRRICGPIATVPIRMLSDGAAPLNVDKFSLKMTKAGVSRHVIFSDTSIARLDAAK